MRGSPRYAARRGARQGDQVKNRAGKRYRDGTSGQAAFQAALQRVLALKSSLAK
jgi:hypothetical protein